MCVIFATCCIFSDFYMLNIYCGICVGFLCVWGGGSCIRNDTRDFTGLEMGLVVVACGPSSDVTQRRHLLLGPLKPPLSESLNLSSSALRVCVR